MVDRAAKEMALAYGLDTIVIDRELPTEPGKTLYTANTAVARGKPALTTESGSLGQTDEDSIAGHIRGVSSVIAQLGIMDFPRQRARLPVFVGRRS